MIDGVKICVPLAGQALLRGSDRIRWVQNGFFPDGKPKYWGTWKGWNFVGDAKHCTGIRGSFHKYVQDGSNWCDFGLKELTTAVQDFCLELLLHDAQLILQNVEIGVNIQPSTDTTEVLRSFVHHKLKAPSWNDYGVEFRHDGYLLKIYDKAKQYDLPEPLLRFEVKVTNMRELKALGIKTVADLLDPQKWQGIEQFLLKKFDDMLIAERVAIPAHYSAKDRETLQYATSLSYWADMTTYTRSRKRARLNTLYARLPGCDLRERLRDSIQKKVRELTPRVTPTQVQRIAAFTPRVMGYRMGRNPPSYAAFTPLIARGAEVAARHWVWWRCRGPPQYPHSSCLTGREFNSFLTALHFGMCRSIRATKRSLWVCSSRWTSSWAMM